MFFKNDTMSCTVGPGAGARIHGFASVLACTHAVAHDMSVAMACSTVVANNLGVSGTNASSSGAGSDNSPSSSSSVKPADDNIVLLSG